MVLADWTRFWSKVDKTPTCWFWTRQISKDGYGRFQMRSKATEAHRLAYSWCVGEIPQDKEIDHLCRHRSCVNPSHLEAVSKRVNILRGYGTGAKCARMTHCKNGHPLKGDNLVKTDLRRGRRRCRTCANAYALEWYKS